MSTELFDVVIVGAGFGGMGAAIELKKLGYDNIVLLEREDDLGGTWHVNRYPGLAVDIPSTTYSYWFEPNPHWTRLFATGSELKRYAEHVADKYDVRRHMRFNTTVEGACWDDEAQRWQVSLADGATLSARYLITATGFLSQPHTPDIPGIAGFQGKVVHTTAWDDSYDADGKRVAVIGTGSSGVQISGALSARAANLDVYQRTPAWVLPKVDFDFTPWMHSLLRLPGVVPAANAVGRLAMDIFMVAPIVHVFSRMPEKWLRRLMPLYDGWSRLLYRLLLRVVVEDPATRRKLVPRYGILAKRPVISSAFLPALNNPNTNLITTPIERVTATGIRTADGVDHPADLLVLATGYELWIDPETYRPETIMGARGFDLAQYYRAHGLQSYAGTAHPRLPNRWEIVGPLGFVGFAWLDYVETVAAHAVRIIDETRRHGAQVATVSQDAFNRWNARMRRDGRVAHLYYTATSGLNTYFVNSQHETPYYRPQTITGSRHFARNSPLSDYQFTNVRVSALTEEQPA